MTLKILKLGLLIGALAVVGCDPTEPGQDAGPDLLDGSDPDGGADGGVTDGGNNTDGGADGGVTDGGNNTDGGADGGADGGVKVDAGPDADSDWEFAKAVLQGRKWAEIEEGSPTPTRTGTFFIGTFSSPGCTTRKGLGLDVSGQLYYCFDPATMHYSWYEDANYYIEADFTFCNDCASYTGTIKDVCLRHRHVSGHCHPDWSDQWFVDGPWVIIKSTFYNGSIYKSTLVSGGD